MPRLQGLAGWTAAVAVLGAVLLLSGWVHTAGAASPGWVVQHAANPAGSPIVSLNDVSCSAPDACTTVGTSTVGASQPGTTSAVTVAERWNGSQWAAQATPDPPGATLSNLTGVSCPSPTECTAVGYEETCCGDTLPFAESWEDGVWTLQPAPARPRVDPSYLFTVSCASTNSCQAVGYDENDVGTAKVLVEGWNGTRWAIEAAPGMAALGSLFGVSCPRASDCIAVGVANSGAPLAERWDGSQWSLLSPARPPGVKNVTLSDVSCSSASDCVTAGYTVNKVEGFATLSEVWNGATWTIEQVPTPAGATQAALGTLSCASAKSCLAVGEFYRTGLQSHVLAESWNGTAWKILPGSGRGSLNAVSCPSADQCTVVGAGPLAESWNGTAWTTETVASLDGTTQSSLGDVSCSAASTCTAVGSYWSGGTEESLAERRSASAWTVEPTPDPAGSRNTTLEGVSCPSSSACVAVGSFVVNNPFFKSFAEVWDEAGWTLERLHSPGRGDTEIDVPAVSCASDTSCVAVGSYQDASGIELTLVEGWDGSSWTVVPSPNPPGEEVSAFTSVSCPSTNSCTAVGSWASVNGVDLTLAATWNGSTWSIEPTPDSTGQTASTLAAVSCSAPNACTAVGESGGNPLAMDWDGSSWSLQTIAPLSGGGSLTAVSCRAEAVCHATGSAGGQPVAEAWDGTSWSLETTPTLPDGGSFAGISCATTTRCSAVGSTADDSGTPQVLAERGP